MTPPPGSQPHPIGQGLVVAFRPSPGRVRLMWVGVAIMVAMLVLIVVAGFVLAGISDQPGLALFALCGVPLAGLTLLILGLAIVMSGPVLVVDDAGLRFRDLVGWLQVPWSGVQDLSVQGGTLTVTAPEGIYLNEKRSRRSRQLFPIGRLQADGGAVATYLHHRWSLARSGVRT